MPAWKNITLNVPEGDLNEISEKTPSMGSSVTSISERGPYI